ncbi:PaaI family thioesterase [Ornithinibacillus sp. 4-3]|uniref:PaaI family thioesterase n=1 Tax=Ornithinibacillus sp. 4-3 TaxID=3231488 RepID=A0AB39HQ76_9BACI
MEERLKRLEREFNESTFWQFLGIHIIEIKEGTAKTELNIHPSLLNVNGTLHGGIYATILDSTMGLTSRTIGMDGSVTLQMNVQFLSSVTNGKVYAEANIVHRTRSTALVEGKLYDETNKLLAHSTATFKMIRK